MSVHGTKEARRTLSCLFGELRREDDVILDEQVAVRSWVLEKRHAFVLDGLHETRLRDALSHQWDDVSVQVGQVTREAEQCLDEKKGRGGGGKAQ